MLWEGLLENINKVYGGEVLRMNGLKDTASWVSCLKEFYFIFSLNFKDGNLEMFATLMVYLNNDTCDKLFASRHQQERIGNFNSLASPMEEQILIDQAMNLHH